MVDNVIIVGDVNSAEMNAHTALNGAAQHIGEPVIPVTGGKICVAKFDGRMTVGQEGRSIKQPPRRKCQ